MGLVLLSIKSKCNQYDLFPIFGLIPTSVSVWIDYGMEVLYRVSEGMNHPEMSIKSGRKLKEWTSQRVYYIGIDDLDYF